jgi:hypothetical protein
MLDVSSLPARAPIDLGVIERTRATQGDRPAGGACERT